MRSSCSDTAPSDVIKRTESVRYQKSGSAAKRLARLTSTERDPSMLVGSDMSTLRHTPNGSLRASPQRRAVTRDWSSFTVLFGAGVRCARDGRHGAGGRGDVAGAGSRRTCRHGCFRRRVVVAPRDFSDGDSLIATLSSAGARPLVVYLPRTALASVTPAAAGQLRGEGYTILRAGAAVSGATANTAAALATLNDLAGAASAAGSEPVVPSGLASLGDDVKFPGADGATGTTVSAVATNATTATDATSVSSLTAVAGLAAPAFLGGTGWLPTASEPAAFAAGSVAVSIIFPQSTRTHSAESPESWATPDPDTAYDQPDAAYPTLSLAQGYIVAEDLARRWSGGPTEPGRRASDLRHPGGRRHGRAAAVPPRAPESPARSSASPSTSPRPDDHSGATRSCSGAEASQADRRRLAAARDRLRQRGAQGQPHRLGLHPLRRRQPRTSHDKTPGEFANVFDAFAYTFASRPGQHGDHLRATRRLHARQLRRRGGPRDRPRLRRARRVQAADGGLPQHGRPVLGLPLGARTTTRHGRHDPRRLHHAGRRRKASTAYKGTDYKRPKPSLDGGICPSTRGQIGWRTSNAQRLPDVLDTRRPST